MLISQLFGDRNGSQYLSLILEVNMSYCGRDIFDF
jgi:hypothetical protein